MDYLENTIQLIAILAALLVSLFQYIARRNRTWFRLVAFYLGNLLSCYFWAAYLVIMGDTPNVSDALAYFGWDLAYLFLILILYREKSPEERRYFHPLMLVPIPLNLAQLFLYLQYGGLFNNTYQVTAGTIIICGCLQTFLWYRKKHGEGLRRPYATATIFLYFVMEFGMWTSSCFSGFVGALYFPCSFICSFSLLALPFAVAKSLPAADEEGASQLIGGKILHILQGTYATVVIGCSLGGILFGVWIRDVLTAGISGDAETGVYDIITVILFLISLVIAASVIVIIFVVYFEQKVLENNKLREARRIAEQSNAAKSEFLAAMSHEIRTPMNAVLGMNEMVLHESRRTREDLPKDRARIREVFDTITSHAEDIDSAGKSLLSIINDILDFSKIEAGKMEIREDRYELSSVLNDVSNMIVFRAQAKGLSYVVEVDEDLPDALYGDAIRVRQIILNVLNNAVKYTREGSVSLIVKGRPAAAAETEEETGAEVPQTYSKGRRAELTITVRDTGIGIKEEDLNRLFGEFERMDLEQNNTIEGTGLGLAITQKLLDLMHGSIEVKSKYGKGSEFILHLAQEIVSPEPIGNFRERFEQNREAARSEVETLSAPDARILIVDDTQMNLMVAKGLLADTQITIDTAMSGIDALAFAAEHTYDLILMDQRMPEMDGAETLRRIRAQEEEHARNPVPVICLTADAIAGARQRYVEQGFTDYLSKPIDQNALIRMVREYLPQDKVLDEAPEAEIKQEKASPPGSGVDLFDALRAAGVDPEQGLRYAGNQRDFYVTILEEYSSKTPERSERLREYYEDRDIANYAILVHALKSNARMIGAEALGDSAEKLQNAADGGDWSYIEQEHAAFLALYDRISTAIAAAL